MDKKYAETDMPQPNGLAGYRDFWVHRKLLKKYMKFFCLEMAFDAEVQQSL